MIVLNILGVIVSTFLVGVVYALYVKFLAENKMLKAAIYGELIVILGAFATINYVHNNWYIIPAVIGGFLGTLYSTKLSKFLGI